MTRRGAAALALVIGASGCGDPIGAGAIEGDYPLARVDGKPLPASHILPNGCTRIYTSGTLHIASPTFWSINLVYYFTCPNGSVSSMGSLTSSGGYTLVGDSITLTGYLAEKAFFPSFAGRLTSSGIAVHRTDALSGQPTDPLFYLSPRVATAP